MKRWGTRMSMEMYKSLPEGTLAELIDNVLREPPSPTYRHQEASLKIIVQLVTQLSDKGKVVPAPFDIYLDEISNAVQPDVVVILNDNTGRLEHEGHFHGVPDLLVEILSKGNHRHDQVRKKELYERFGVKEYWIVEPPAKVVMLYSLVENRYRLSQQPPGEIKSPLLGLTVTF